jgi:predicted MFS family arabinose efflux permease
MHDDHTPGLTGPKNTGKAIAWVGMAMYVASAVGAPIGTALYARYGFMAIGLATIVFLLPACCCQRHCRQLWRLPRSAPPSARWLVPYGCRASA